MVSEYILYQLNDLKAGFWLILAYLDECTIAT